MSPIMKSTDLTADAPPGICSECCAFGIEHISSGFRACYCKHHLCGVWRFSDRPWEVKTGVTFSEFRGDVGILLMEIDYQQNGGDDRDRAGLH